VAELDEHREPLERRSGLEEPPDRLLVDAGIALDPLEAVGELEDGSAQPARVGVGERARRVFGRGKSLQA
jgi:hypothetical protein